ncbi:tRNA (adenosine(37)-N6)-threonylcarbamoyltransferase complex dimerization subunit type 1 TsaB [Motiliproteus sp. MSK22-1]|uniref:tRNA (adenosine(37)-N6)-threonylcarbamoyltransferase complex dimerization subunit type 1 TsaB n=1 Tax=Motiliproteus sp. MSK22-1 TaxID=1897630 RepID=UPI000978BCD1|nr:tRNA (adenosine(37)-N6)-threonylcarbamoyltransferase complex dimerization subunit type 1 TsaB [Motiliproteus sp. MSK22-1]OMH30232.1 tRNA (adenosine(37)-N6)-threonylcarbamoyltransferase complex dimerization subunit type 1 TsaB [Motiliproteus sp. MSK22-1]
MTKILTLDTSSEACSAALYIDGQVQECFEVVPRQHTQKLLPMVNSLLAEAGLELSQLDGIGFGAGPGSFTGLRITTGVAQGLAFGADLPLLPISTLAALAQEVREEQNASHIFAALDARMGELYWGVYLAKENRVVALAPEQVCPPDKVMVPDQELLHSAPWIGVGPGWNYRDQMPLSLKQVVTQFDVDRQPRAAAMATLAAMDFEAGKGLAVEAAMPVYLRDNVAWKKSNHRD